MKIKINATADRRRAGLSFRARQPVTIDTDALELSKSQKDAIMNDPILQAVEVGEDGDELDTGEDTVSNGVIAELSAQEKAHRLGMLIHLSSEKPDADAVSATLGFDVSGDEIDEAWKAAGKNVEEDAEKFAAFIDQAFQADTTKMPTVAQAKHALGFKVSGAEIKAAWTAKAEAASA